MAQSGSVAQLKFGEYSSDAGYAPLLGQQAQFPDYDVVGGTGTTNSQGTRRCVFVKNGSGGTIAAGNALSWTSGYIGTQVSKSANGTAIAGYAPYSVNGSITATIPNGAYFWAVLNGPTFVMTDGAAITAGHQVEASATAGTIKTEATALAANKNLRAGTCITTADAAGTGETVFAYIHAQSIFA